MFDGYLSFEDGEVKIGGMLLPGLFVTQRVSAGVRFDKSHHDNQSGKRKIPLGWEDADVTLTLNLTCDDQGDCYSKLMAINGIFKGPDAGANPRIFEVTNRHLRARGVSKVVFAGLESNEDNQTDEILVTLSFTEHLPAIVKREKQVNASKAAVGAPPPAVKATPAASPAIVAEPVNPFMAGLNAGSN
jgi:hypothetical protein